MIWANSGDSHLDEPDDLFATALPPALAERMPRSVKADDGRTETIHVDGQSFQRRIPRSVIALSDIEGNTLDDERAPGANDLNRRLHDLDREGIWAELVYPSIGIWMSSIRDPELLAAGCRAINDWAFEFQRRSLRHVPTATIPLLTVEHAVEEVERAADVGFKAAYLSVAPPRDEDWNDPMWEPLWSACEETGLVIGYHVGTEPHDASKFHGAYYRGPGGALLNYVEPTYGGTRAPKDTA